MTTTLCLTSDLHGILPDSTPECDILVIAGDLSPYWDHRLEFQQDWLTGKFAAWCKKQPAGKIIAIPGNHDRLMEIEKNRLLYNDPEVWTLLIDEPFEHRGINFWGSPWSKKYNNWHFMLEENGLFHRYEQIPEGTDVLISHGPPYGICDTIWYQEHENLGSAELFNRLRYTTIQLVVCGHIHTGHGIGACNNTIVANASQVNERYETVYQPMMAHFEGNKLIDVRQL